jgi:hypothetical protein
MKVRAPHLLEGRRIGDRQRELSAIASFLDVDSSEAKKAASDAGIRNSLLLDDRAVSFSYLAPPSVQVVGAISKWKS